MIENVRYISETQETINATINGEKLSIPVDPANRHYQAILEWLAEDSRRVIAAYIAPPVDTTPTLEDRIATLEAEVETLRARS